MSGHVIRRSEVLHYAVLTVGSDVFYVIIETLLRMSYLLTTDATQISSISSMRVMVTAALLYAFTVLPTTPRSTTSSLPLSTSSVAR